MRKRQRRTTSRQDSKFKLRKGNVKRLLIDNLCYVAGASLYAAAVMIFAVPNQIAQSGMTGVAILINHLTNVPVGVLNLGLNVILLAIAWKFLGKVFVAKTLWVTVVLSAALDIFGEYLPTYQGDRLLATLYCGVLSGVGLGLVFLRGTTSGGTDIIARLVHMKWPHITVGRVLMVTDVVVVIAAAAVFRSLESALYAVIVIYISSRMVDYILYGMGSGKMLLVVTQQAEVLAEAITTKMHRGVTILPVEGGYTHTNKQMLLCAVRANEVSRLQRLIWEHEENPFIVVTDAGEILGEGFKQKDAGQ